VPCVGAASMVGSTQSTSGAAGELWTASVVYHPAPPRGALMVLAIIAAILGLAYLRLPGWLSARGRIKDSCSAQVIAPARSEPAHTWSRRWRASNSICSKTRDRPFQGVFAVNGYSYGWPWTGPPGLCFITMKPWEERPGKRNRVQEIAARLNKHFAGSQERTHRQLRPSRGPRAGECDGL